MLFLVANVETFGNPYSLNSAAPGANSIIQSAHKNAYQLTNLSLAFPTLIDFSIKEHLMTAAVLEKGRAGPSAWRVIQSESVPWPLGHWPRAEPPESATVQALSLQ